MTKVRGRGRRKGVGRARGSVVFAARPAIMQGLAQRVKIYLVHQILSRLNKFGLFFVELLGLEVGGSGKVARSMVNHVSELVILNIESYNVCLPAVA